MSTLYILSDVKGTKQLFWLTASPIARGYRKLCWAKITFAFVARLAISKDTFQNYAQMNIGNMNN